MKFPQNFGRFHGNHDSRGIVDGAGSEVPGIEVSGDDDDLLRMFAALQVGDDVVTGRVGQLLRSESEMHADFALRKKMSNEVGIFRGDGAGGNSSGRTEASVRQAEIGATDRAN